MNSKRVGKIFWATWAVLAIVFIIWLVKAYAAEERYNLGKIVVSAHKNPLERSKVGKAVTIVDDGLDLRQSLAEAATLSEGVRVKRTGSESQLATVRIRGARSVDTKLALDGFPLRDPSDPQGSANPLFGDLPSFGVDRIEILRGPASTIHGSEAQGGVVSAFHRDPMDANQAFIEFGAGSTLREGVSVGYLDHTVAIERMDSDGFDAHDDFERSAISGTSKFRFAENTLSASYLFSETDAMLNAPPSVTAGVFTSDRDDENDTREQSLAHLGLRLEGPIREDISYRTSIAGTSTNRRFTFLPNADKTGFFSDGTFEGLDLMMSQELIVEHGERFATTFGHEYGREFLNQRTFIDPKDNLKDEVDQYRNDFFIEETAKLGATTAVFAGRLNTHETVPSRLTWDSSAAHTLPSDTILRVHAGTAYREPSLFELHGAFLSSFGRTPVGNVNLTPERSFGYDFGVEQPFGDWAAGTTYFRIDRTNQIDLRGIYRNVEGDTTSHGLETFVEWHPAAIRGTDVKARLSQTYTAGEELLDVPLHQYALTLTGARGPLGLELSGIRVGDRAIAVFNNSTFRVDRISEKAHVEVNAEVSYKVKENVTLYARGENILDDEHTDGGYRVTGARGYVGARVRF